MYIMKKIKSSLILIFIFFILSGFFIFPLRPVALVKARQMPFYDLKPEYLVLRAQFHTSYSTSTSERKNNIGIAAKSLNNTFIDVGAEFSFNRTVGERSVKRGYKAAKIIVGGKFVDGVGGGVCQVSTTLYNAALLSGMDITEFHSHSLPVSYVAPSFDAMVNSSSADLRFVNNTHNPVIIKTKADGEVLTVSLYGEPMNENYSRKSVIKEYIPAPEPQKILAKEGEFPDLFEGETKVISYGKQGLKSEGYLITIKNGIVLSQKKIRNDRYNPMQGVIVAGCEKNPGKESVSDDAAAERETVDGWLQSSSGNICFDP